MVYAIITEQLNGQDELVTQAVVDQLRSSPFADSLPADQDLSSVR